ncbi:hypothetical protein CEXT_30661 [Caerostris extrusa]|uniref:Uncharacterized protein n=1 Tax=Caerostris extrusa TaxID=172846 RepID=A0AAV4RZA8_CAEEX|nr:hypothetical protein CEXT_30661 [Caerostris extrusa]
MNKGSSFTVILLDHVNNEARILVGSKLDSLICHLFYEVVAEVQLHQDRHSQIVLDVELPDETMVQVEVAGVVHLPVKRVLGHSGKGIVGQLQLVHVVHPGMQNRVQSRQVVVV